MNARTCLAPILLPGLTGCIASRAEVEDTVGFRLPPSATHLRSWSRDAGLRDSGVNVSFTIARNDRATLQGSLRCALYPATGPVGRCDWWVGHDWQQIEVHRGLFTDDVRISVEQLDNSSP